MFIFPTTKKNNKNARFKFFPFDNKLTNENLAHQIDTQTQKTVPMACKLELIIKLSKFYKNTKNRIQRAINHNFTAGNISLPNFTQMDASSAQIAKYNLTKKLLAKI